MTGHMAERFGWRRFVSNSESDERLGDLIELRHVAQALG